ncbi:MAG: hypothetical protein IKV54_02865 [Clostridia bacterium]|nr:hypothetical protein [Clostridia bacterium]
MTPDTPNSIGYLGNRKKILMLSFIVMLIASVAARVFNYLYSNTFTDIMFMNTYLPTALYFISGVFDIVLMFVAFGTVIYYAVTSGVKRSILPLILGAVATLVSYILILALNLIEYGARLNIPVVIKYLGANYLSEILRLIIIWVLSLLVARISGRRASGFRYAAPGFSPASSAYSFCALISAVIIFTGKALTELMNNTLPFFAEYSGVTGQEIWSMILTYLLILVTSVIGYLTVHLTGMLIFRTALKDSVGDGE